MLRFPLQLTVAALFFGLAAEAVAVDGVLEINQACAVNIGCFPGDDPGFPVTIQNEVGRSFRLTSDLDLRTEDTNTGAITSDIVGTTLDLNGFDITGPVDCALSGASVACSAESGANGITASFRTTIHDGRVSSFGGDGINVKSGHVRNVEADRNAGAGLRLWNDLTSLLHGSIVSDCISNANAASGITVSFGHVRNSYAMFNKSDGITISGGGSVLESTARSNGGDGIDVATNPTTEIVSNCTSVHNLGVGIRGADGVQIRNNLVSENDGEGILVGKAGVIEGNTVYHNGAHGMFVNSSNLIAGNTIRKNGGFGIFFFGSQSNYHGNVISLNRGTVGFGEGNSAINTGQNTCDDSTTCP